MVRDPARVAAIAAAIAVSGLAAWGRDSGGCTPARCCARSRSRWSRRSACKPGDTACDLMCDGGTLGVALGAAVGSARDGACSSTPMRRACGALRGDVAAPDVRCSTRLAVGGSVPRGLRVVRPGGVAVHRTDSGTARRCSTSASGSRVPPDAPQPCSTWDAAQPPAHEVALVDALRDVAGVSSRFLARCLQAQTRCMRPALGSVTCTTWCASTVSRTTGRRWWSNGRSPPSLPNDPRGAPATVRAGCQRDLPHSPPPTGPCASRFARRSGAPSGEGRALRSWPRPWSRSSCARV